jgi:hypothetical protein
MFSHLEIKKKVYSLSLSMYEGDVVCAVAKWLALCCLIESD